MLNPWFRSSYYFGEAPDIHTNGYSSRATENHCDNTEDGEDNVDNGVNNHHAPISPHTGEVSYS